MARLSPVADDNIPAAAKPLLDFGQNLMGFTPNDALIMARNPALLKASADMVGALYGGGTVEPGLKRLIGYITSSAAGCKYCQVHTADGAHKAGVDDAKIKAAWDYETSDLFTDRERAALRVAQGGGVTPSAVTDAEFADLKTYFSDDEIVEIVGVIAMFGFLNRWNSVMGTELENNPLAYAASINLETR
ncbi:carboxymuconolactone decarboxylase family protein [Fretibacter rubidus]|uniref:carboxymuconolactone decarboxylase family protein n=1 Tax=Fretibacter rubidus TaxID=570162 RepID=UPI00352A172F